MNEFVVNLFYQATVF